MDNTAIIYRKRSLLLAFYLRARNDTGPAKTMGASEDLKINSIEAHGEYIILDMENKKDHINMLLNYMKHKFSSTSAQNNVVEDAKHFDLKGLFTKYTLSPFSTPRKLTTFALNISKYNSVVSTANNNKKSPTKPSAFRAGGSSSASKLVPSPSRVSEGPYRHSTSSKRSSDDGRSYFASGEQ